MGDTKFAPGEWAGVALDEAQGKNDGSVGGVVYFTVRKIWQYVKFKEIKEKIIRSVNQCMECFQERLDSQLSQE